MPSCGDETLKAMRELYERETDETSIGNHYGWDSFASSFLEKHGIKCDKNFYFIVPKDHNLTDDECTCLDYMCDEWDYGWSRAK